MMLDFIFGGDLLSLRDEMMIREMGNKGVYGQGKRCVLRYPAFQ